MTAVKIGEKAVASFEGAGHAPDVLKAKGKEFADALAAAIKEAGYPARADPNGVNNAMVLLLLTIMMIYTAMVYGLIAATLVEFFPTCIRYTYMSLPYHIGNGWFGGFLPTVSVALVTWKGDIYFGLW